jgi:hypothetical protein
MLQESTAEITFVDGGSHALDPIHVFWLNDSPGRGYVTIICYGSAWTAYFGAMGGNTIQEFFASVDVAYMVNALSRSRTLKTGKNYVAYLSRVVKAVQDKLRAEARHSTSGRGR